MDENSDLSVKISKLRELVSGEKNLVLRQDDNFFTRFLYCCNCDVEAAFEKLKNYYQTKKRYPEWFAKGDKPVEEYRNLYNIGMDFILEGRDKQGRRIILGRMAKLDPSVVTIQERAQFNDLFFESIFDEPETQKNGIAVIVDMKNSSWSLIRWMTPGNMRAINSKVESEPCIHWDYHIMNPSWLFYYSYKMMYPILSERMRRSFHIHGSLESLFEYISPEVLPEDYGGKLPLLDSLKLDHIIFDKSEQILENLRLGYKDDAYTSD